MSVDTNESGQRTARDWSLVRSAMDLAITLNETEYRKGTDIPYLSHLLSVTALVYEHGGDDEQVAAALLHDAAEDQGGHDTLRLIDSALPDHPRVAEMVEALSDAIVTDRAQKAPWPQRKRAYLAKLRGEDPSVLLVSVADKLHNCTSLVEDYRVVGEALWERFNAGVAHQLWYYAELAELFAAQLPGRLTDRFTRIVDELFELVRANRPDLDREVDEVRDEQSA